ncbi:MULTISPECIES: DUF485 domain-containing protein [unclassified Burkholderia]|uniref:DUF485 domain-containing protein n=1 Tax=unclassified Burkholderia TaxID=2613784 RepID=UPI0005CF2AB9|nr:MULTISPECIES: DUF485 domain-containing protein [unclassified Burkholderia]TGN95207.1 DUF485 domain-containing protein [Burkholderia sp. USMB20]
MNHPLPATAGTAPDLDSPPQAMHPLLRDARFRTLVRRRRLLAWSLTLVMLTLYFAFILTLAFSPALLGQPIVPGRPTPWGIPVGFGMFVVTFALVALYVFQANSVHDALVASLRHGDTP